MLYTAKCPKCGAEQKGLNLKETKGSVVCYNCDTKFKVEIAELNESINIEQNKESGTAE